MKFTDNELRKKEIMDKPVKDKRKDFEGEKEKKKNEEMDRKEKIFELVGPFV